eukprot:m.67977 g.67977  ORF g.67977 m.67977 type:complete len:345 (-) comp11927_c0_seq1:90-1124(-)
MDSHASKTSTPSERKKAAKVGRKLIQDVTKAFGYEVDSADHAETPTAAYQDVLPIIDEVLKLLKKTRKTVRVYDPYFCDGAAVNKLASLGFEHVYNRCEDFYKKIEKNSIPDHDIVITNPPYSGDHIMKIFQFCTKNKDRPWFILVPFFCYKKQWYIDEIAESKPFILVPKEKYFYFPPSWAMDEFKARHKHAGQWTSPFHTFWYCHPGSQHILKQLLHWQQTYKPPPRGCVVCARPEEIPFHPQRDHKKKRLNPKARKRAKKRAEMDQTNANGVEQDNHEQFQPPKKKRKESISVISGATHSKDIDPKRPIPTESQQKKTKRKKNNAQKKHPQQNLKKKKRRF